MQPVLAMVSLAVIAASSPGLAQAPDAASEDPGAALDRAAAALAAGDGVGAEARYRELVEAHPGLIGAHRGVSRALAAQGRRGEAADGLRRLGEGLLSAGRYRDAADVLAEGAGLDGADPALRVALGRSLMLDQRFGEAVPQLERAVELGAGAPAVRVYLGLAQWESGSLAEAEATLRAVYEAGSNAPGSEAAGQQLGRLLLWRGEHAEAIELLRGAARAEPESVDRQLDLARALEGDGQAQAALAVYDRAIALAGDRYPPRYSRARLLLRLGRRDEARAELARYEELYRAAQEGLRGEGTLRARLDRGWELLAAGEAARAAELFAAFPDQVDALIGLALANAARGEHASAASALERAVTLAPDRQDLRLMLLEQRQAGGGR